KEVVKVKDIYFEKNYGKLYEKLEKGTSDIFEYNSSIGSVRHMFIKREIPLSVNGEIYFDLVSPYGYGGPIITEYKLGCKSELLKGFENDFKKYCSDNKIVSEFVRFHPIICNAIDFKGIYNI